MDALKTLPFLLLLLLLASSSVDGSVYSSSPANETQIEGRRILSGDEAFYSYASRVTGFSMEFSTQGGGTFLTLRHVLTTGQLVHNMLMMTVYYGNHSMGWAKGTNGVGRAHPDYDPVTFANNLGIVVLGVEASDELVAPIALPEGDFFFSLPGRRGRVAGFGLAFEETRGWFLNFPMQTGEFRVIEDGECQVALQENSDLLLANQFCTENAARLCFGLHGAALTMSVDGQETVVGVLSLVTNMCHETFPVIFTQVDSYLSWIRENIQE